MKERITEVADQPAITLPKEYLEQLNMKVGDEVLVKLDLKTGVILVFKPQQNQNIEEWSEEFIEKNREFYEKLKDK